MTEVATRHGDGCECTRCRGFERGNGLALRHGAYSMLTQAPRAGEIADELREIVPTYSPADEPAVRLLALMLGRIELASAALDQLDETADAAKLQRLRQDALGWVNAARRLMNDLGMTPTSRARLGLDLVRTEDTLVQLAAEGRLVRERAQQLSEVTT